MAKKAFMALLTDAELIYMNIIWDNPNGINSGDLYKVNSDYARSKTANLLHQIVKKEFAIYEKSGRHYNYYPLITKEEYGKIAAKTEVEKLLPTDTNMVQMIAAFCGKATLTEQEYSRINNLLEKLEKDLNNEPD